MYKKKALWKKIYITDDFGVRNYRASFLGLIGISVLYSAITLMSFVLLWFETQMPDANITSYGSAFWTLQMSASTIGFGDYFPITLGGRMVVAAMFYVGVGIIGFIGVQIADHVLGFANTNVKNRELRKQNEELLNHSKVLEKKLDLLVNAIAGRSG